MRYMKDPKLRLWSVPLPIIRTPFHRLQLMATLNLLNHQLKWVIEQMICRCDTTDNNFTLPRHTYRLFSAMHSEHFRCDIVHSIDMGRWNGWRHLWIRNRIYMLLCRKYCLPYRVTNSIFHAFSTFSVLS